MMKQLLLAAVSVIWSDALRAKWLPSITDRSASSHVSIQILEEHLADRAIGMSIVVILAQGIEILDREIRKPC